MCRDIGTSRQRLVVWIGEYLFEGATLLFRHFTQQPDCFGTVISNIGIANFNACWFEAGEARKRFGHVDQLRS